MTKEYKDTYTYTYISIMSTDFYKTLGVERNCSEDDIKKSYRKLAMRWHPDKHSQESEENKKKAEEKFKEINQAYEILSNRDKRNKYDLLGDGDEFTQSEGFQFNNPNDIFNSFFQSFSGQNNPLGGFDFDTDMFPQSMKQGQKIHINFGGRRSFQDHTNNTSMQNKIHTKQHIVKTEPIYVDLFVSLEDLYHGITKKMKISRKIHTQSTVRDETEILSVDVKPGWKEGTKITFNNKGDVKPGTEPADIIFIVKEKPHPTFTRSNNDLITVTNITYKDAMHGFEKIIPGIESESTHNITVKNGMNSSEFIYKIPGKGMPIRKAGVITGHGDLLVKFNVIFK